MTLKNEANMAQYVADCLTLVDNIDSLDQRGMQNTLTKAVNNVIEAAASRAGDIYVDLYTPFKGSEGTADPTRLLAADGDHPDAAGHQVIARQLLVALGAA